MANNDLKYHWRVNFRIEYVRLEKEWSADDLRMVPHVEKRQGLSDKNEIHGHCLVETKGDDQKEAEAKAKEKIEGVFASCSVMTGNESLQASYIIPPEVLNEEELKAKGFSVTRFVGPIVLYGEGRLSSETLDSSFSFLQKVNALPDATIVKLIMGWFKKALDYNEPYDRFIAFWISFNAFYNLYYTGPANDPETTKMETLTLKLFDETEAKQLLDENSGIISQIVSLKGQFLSQSGKTDFAEELDKELKAKNYISALEKSIRCLYCARKTLIHGARGIAESEKKIVEELNPFLKQIIRRSLLKYVTGKI